MGFYSGTVFHRVVPGFVVQGGGFDRQLRLRTTLGPVANESKNGISNARGTVAAARTDDPNSATAQFFVNLEDNTPLDAGSDAGYTVFGRVKEGIGVFDAIGRLPTGAAGPFRADVPTPLVAIKSVARLDADALDALPSDGREAALKEDIAAAVAANDRNAALRLIGQYRAICGADDTEISLTEARLALEAQDRRRALFALEELLATTAATDPAYATATGLRDETLAAAEAGAPAHISGCEPPAAPNVPDGSTASQDDMLSAQREVRAFVAAAENYLKCLATVIDDQDREAPERNAAVGEHNRMIAVMEQIAAAFNEQIRAFKARG
jgi:cyclophilin family peptidyl-prolyl cis-trans isomerase